MKKINLLILLMLTFANSNVIRSAVGTRDSKRGGEAEHKAEAAKPPGAAASPAAASPAAASPAAASPAAASPKAENLTEFFRVQFIPGMLSKIKPSYMQHPILKSLYSGTVTVYGHEDELNFTYNDLTKGIYLPVGLGKTFSMEAIYGGSFNQHVSGIHEDISYFLLRTGQIPIGPNTSYIIYGPATSKGSPCEGTDNLIHTSTSNISGVVEKRQTPWRFTETNFCFRERPFTPEEHAEIGVKTQTPQDLIERYREQHEHHSS